MLISLALIVFALVVWVAVVAGLVYFTRWAWTDDNIGSRWMAVGGAIFAVGSVLLPLALITGDLKLSSVPDGCYRISSTTSTGVSVVPTSNGGVSVVPIVLSGKTYEPIGCP